MSSKVPEAMGVPTTSVEFSTIPVRPVGINTEFEVAERLILQLDGLTLGNLIKIRYLCDREPNRMLCTSWDALALLGISRDDLMELNRKKLIGLRAESRQASLMQIKA